MKLLVNTLSVSCVKLPFIVQWPHHISSVNIIKLTKMDEHLWSHCYFIVLRSGTSWQRKKLQMSQNTDFHFAICRFRKYRFSFPFANCSKPFFLIQCLSQFLKLIVRPPLNYSFFFFFKGLVSGNGNLFSTFPRLGC